MSSSTEKISLPTFLKVLTGSSADMKRAMSIAGKIYKHCNTPDALAQLTDQNLKDLGLDSEEDRKLLLLSLSKAGYTKKPGPSPKRKVGLAPNISESRCPKERKPAASSSKPQNKPITTPSKPIRKKRKHRQLDENEFLPSGPSEKGETEGTWEFKEVLDEQEVKAKSVIINRAPVMMAWSLLVAEKMNFSRPEALTSVYTELNAVSKGVSIGKYNQNEARGREAVKDGSQPYVELMGRRPLYRTAHNQWRALSNGQPIAPNQAFDYITRSFRQTTPFIMGALKLLADTYSSTELNQKAWSLYADFRPEVNEWGKRSELLCSKILDLRKKVQLNATGDSSLPSLMIHDIQLQIDQEQKPNIGYDEDVESPLKKAKTMSVEEYEAMLDDDSTFEHIDLDIR
ncbi:hypothetical protein CPB83DRAFT_902202 [Crepidotus variabilis]|uniref:Uncharacterized protein n=1 Tax=Crepidotus variabilis TaxID=179855 RepID=A0A9P6EQK9_9AGAR|nr:hypothetical protein CPB83DRAFT_902202 [Crepidotus variabilis]